MSRFGSVIAPWILSSCFLGACGDKLLPKDQGPTVPTDDSGSGTGTYTNTDTGIDAGTGACPGGSLPGVDASSATATSTSTAVSVTYTKDIQPLLKKYCTPCHSPSGEQPPYLDSYSAAKANAANSLYQIQNGLMPQAGPRMSAAEVSLFEAWVNGPQLQ